LHRVNQAIGINSPSLKRPAAPAPVVPPMAALEFKLVELPTPQDDSWPRRNASSSHEDEAQGRTEKEALREVLGEAAKVEAERHRMPRGGLECRWYELVPYPVRAFAALVALASGWATLIFFLVFVMAHLPDPLPVSGSFSPLPLGMWIFLLAYSLFAFVLLGCTLSRLQMTLGTAISDEGELVPDSRNGLARTVRRGNQGVWCFLTGPIVPVVVAFFFWLGSGDLLLVDRLILWELGIVAVGYWILTLLAVQQRGRFRDANPVAVVQLIKRQGYPPFLAAMLIAAALVAHAAWIFNNLHALQDGFGGWLLLTGSWIVQLLWITVVFRWLGNRGYGI